MQGVQRDALFHQVMACLTPDRNPPAAAWRGDMGAVESGATSGVCRCAHQESKHS